MKLKSFETFVNEGQNKNSVFSIIVEESIPVINGKVYSIDQIYIDAEVSWQHPDPSVGISYEDWEVEYSTVTKLTGVYEFIDSTGIVANLKRLASLGVIDDINSMLWDELESSGFFALNDQVARPVTDQAELERLKLAVDKIYANDEIVDLNLLKNPSEILYDAVDKKMKGWEDDAGSDDFDE